MTSAAEPVGRFLIVGTGRSGTRYTAEALRAGGLTVGHQTFRHEHTLGRPFDWPDGMDGIVSFEATPAVNTFRLRYPDLNVVWVDRRIEDVTASWLRLGAFDDDHRDRWLLWGIVLDRYLPWVLEADTPTARAHAYVLGWSEFAQHLPWLSVHDPDYLDRLYDAIVPGRPVPDAARAVPTDLNHEVIDE